MSPLVSLHRISFSYADKPVISDATFAINDGQTVGLMGVNGVGKSTLLRLIAGDLMPETGALTRHHAEHDLAFFHQHLTPQPGVSVQDYLATRTGIASAEASFLDASDAFAAGAISAETYDSVLQRYLDADVASFGDRALATLGDLGGFDRLWTQDVATLSGGELSAVQLAAIVLSKARLVVLDEPTNNVDAAGLAVLDEFLDSHCGAVVLVSHDRAMLRRHVTDVVVIDEFTRTCTTFHGGWEAYEREAERAANRAQAAYDAYDARRTELENRAKRERQWSEQGQRRATSAKRRREEPDKHLRHGAVVSAQNVSGRAKATERELARLETVEEPREPWRLRLSLTAGGPTSTDALVVEQAEVALGGKRWGPMNFELSVGERVRLAGPNGSGKTTLLRTALGELELVAGSVRRSPSVRLGYMDQRRSVFQADSPRRRGGSSENGTRVRRGPDVAGQVPVGRERGGASLFITYAWRTDARLHGDVPGEPGGCAHLGRTNQPPGCGRRGTTRASALRLLRWFGGGLARRSVLRRAPLHTRHQPPTHRQTSAMHVSALSHDAARSPQCQPPNRTRACGRPNPHIAAHRVKDPPHMPNHKE